MPVAYVGRCLVLQNVGADVPRVWPLVIRQELRVAQVGVDSSRVKEDLRR